MMTRRLLRVLPVLLLFTLTGTVWAAPTLPTTFDTSLPVVTGSTRTVSAGGNLQAAIDAAAAEPNQNLNHEIVVEAGASFTGPFTLRWRAAGSGWILIRSSSSALPPVGQRVFPSDAGAMPKIVVPSNEAGFRTEAAAGVRNYRLIGLEIHAQAGAVQDSNFDALVTIGAGSETSLGALPTDIVVDRCYIHANPGQEWRRGVSLNGIRNAVIESYLTEFKSIEGGLIGDTQAIMGWNGPGPFKIVNNRLEGGAENVMFGGADPTQFTGCDPLNPATYDNCLVPSDIEIRRNHFSKGPLGGDGQPVWRGVYLVKNLFELKNARRVLVEGNVFEYSWRDPAPRDGQLYSIVLTVRNQDDTAPWSLVQDVTFRLNKVRHVQGGVGILTCDDNILGQCRSRTSNRILIENNVFEDMSVARWGSNGSDMANALAINNFVTDPSSRTWELDVNHNTMCPDNKVSSAQDETGLTGTLNYFRNNIMTRGALGVWGRDVTEGNPAIDRYLPGLNFLRNDIIGADNAIYPAANGFTFSPNPDAVRFVNFAGCNGGNYRLQSGAPGENAGTDGKDLGADIDLLDSATAGAISGVWSDVPPTGLVVHLKFDEGTGTVANDASGSGNQGTLLNGPTRVAGRVGPGALAFDGVNDLVRVPNSATWNGGFSQYSVAFWVKVKTTGAASDFRVALGVGDWTNGTLRVYRDPSGGWAYVVNTTDPRTGWGCAKTTAPLPYLQNTDNTFHHVAVVLDAPSSRCHIYSDGQLVDTDDFVAGVTALGANSLWIGGVGHETPPHFENPLHSEIDDVRIYTRALSAAEVQQLATMR